MAYSLFDLITGSLPAQFGFRTSGIIDIHTKAGATLNGGDLSYYGGSNATIFPSFQLGGSDGRLSYYVLGSYKQDNLGSRIQPAITKPSTIGQSSIKDSPTSPI